MKKVIKKVPVKVVKKVKKAPVKKTAKKEPTKKVTKKVKEKRVMSFKIEKVKWSWASKVSNKGVYRDDEYIRTDSREEALAATEYLMTKPQGLTYTITVQRGDEGCFTYYRHSMPCLGGLVKYRDSHGEKHFMNPYFPRDIRVAFPEGDIQFVACHRQNTKGFFNNPYNEFLFSEESPWVTGFGSRDAVIFGDNYFILTDMNTDPTVFYSLMRQGGFAYGGNAISQWGQKKWHPKSELLAKLNTQCDPRRLAGQKPIRISGGTWAEGFGYTRPYNESIFKTSLPTNFKDFGKLAGYPQAPYTNKYFIDTMKSEFGVELKGGMIPITDKNNEVLLKAWDFYKEQAAGLSAFADDKKAKPVLKNIYDKSA